MNNKVERDDNAIPEGTEFVLIDAENNEYTIVVKDGKFINKE